MIEEFYLFDNRYKVVLGERGKVTVLSVANHDKQLKIYGKKKDGIRFVNLKPYRESIYNSYNLDDIKRYCISGAPLHPMTKEEVCIASRRDDLPCIVNDLDIILSLPQSIDRYGKAVYINQGDIYTQYYSRIDFVNTCNGWHKFRFNVAIKSSYDNHTTHNKTKVFTDRNRITINDIRCVGMEELKEINDLITDRLSIMGTVKEE